MRAAAIASSGLVIGPLAVLIWSSSAPSPASLEQKPEQTKPEPAVPVQPDAGALVEKQIRVVYPGLSGVPPRAGAVVTRLLPAEITTLADTPLTQAGAPEPAPSLPTSPPLTAPGLRPTGLETGVDLNKATLAELNGLSSHGYGRAIMRGRPYRTIDELLTRRILTRAAFAAIKNAVAVR